MAERWEADLFKAWEAFNAREVWADMLRKPGEDTTVAEPRTTRR